MRTAEIFCGTKSFSSVAAERGHSTLTLDFDPVHDADITASVFDWEPTPGIIGVDILWLSPPCQAFSVAVIGNNWNHDYTPKHERAELGLRLVKRAIELIDIIQPKYWFIENPRCMLRKMPCMQPLPLRKTVTYCQYGDTRMKPTDIWTNFMDWMPKPPCKNGAPCHEAAPRGARTGTQGIKGAKDRGKIPPGLFYDLFDQLDLWGIGL